MPDDRQAPIARATEFWKERPLEELTDAEWESLCDGCGRCCLQKLQDEDTEELVFTDVACRLLDTDSCRCSNYPERFSLVSDCLSVRPLTPEKLGWLPRSCAYRRLAEGRELAAWHPLVSGTPDSVHTAGIGVSGRCVSERVVPVAELPQHIIEWVDS